MIHLDYRSRIVFFNLFLYTIVFALVTFLAIQGIWYASIKEIKSELLETSKNAQLMIEQSLTISGEAATGPGENDPAAWFVSASPRLGEILENYSTGTVNLYDASGEPLTSSRLLNRPENYMLEEIATASSGQDAVSLRRFNNESAIWFASPLLSNGQIIGYYTEEVKLGQLESQLNLVLIFLLAAGFGGFIILFILTEHNANEFIKPIKDLTKISREIDNGNYNVFIQYKYDDEIGDLTAVFNEMTANINNIINQLQGEREQYGSVLASLDDGLLALDQKGNVIASNELLKTYFGVSNPRTIYDFTYQSFLRDIFDSLRNSQGYISEEVECNNRVLLLMGSPIHRKDLEENYMIIIRNITATRQFEREQQKFISSVSHELRTPLTTIIGYTDMLRRRQVTDPNLLDNSLSTINKEGHRLVRLVDDLLSASRLDTLEFTVRKSSVSLEEILRGVVDQMRVKGWQKEIEISFKSEPDLPDILGDYDRLSQMFINIIHNAIKYSDKGGLIDVILRQEDNEIVATVRDYGTGIDPDQKQLIFSAFYRVEEDRARNEGEGGAGLGLYLVKQIADKHNGHIQIDSEVGEGTSVSVFLPIPDVQFNTDDEEESHE